MPETTNPEPGVLEHLQTVIDSRKPAAGGDPGSSYVARLLQQGPDQFLKKIGEEATELVMACKDCEHGGSRDRIVSEAADLWFHTLVALAYHDLGASDILAELARRDGLSGLVEKARRPGFTAAG